jgi:hypothetical protein
MMNEFVLYKMASLISARCGTRIDDVLNVLIDFWQDKIAPVWHVDDVHQIAEQEGKPILYRDTIEILKTVFDKHGSSREITRQSIGTALGNYRLCLENLSFEEYGEVHGVFKVWQEHSPFAHQFGLFPKEVNGNFTAAMDFARANARAHPDQKIFIGCESSTGKEVRPWLVLCFENEQIVMKEVES